MVQHAEPTVRYVSVEGPATRITAVTDEMNREMAARYLPADTADAGFSLTVVARERGHGTR
ncbi:hypothetical protein [Rhodococcus tukisamuensis]|uniref:Uncharacterized protein n=1 Tax=Rhodococcus tukisamuensis TaxID=168276 RepID=A0A1G6UZG0_9NOCA|nr:hypothetical protein [Rhodococcus tukisamuensis]SDD46026.1 hypothetical protein SAMN05444580_104329 [Rhodococcus tukisamuensis]